MIKLVLALFLMATAAMAQTAAPDAAELTKLLNDFLAGASRNDPAVHERFWADDLIYTRSAGRRVSKADIMRDLRAAPAPKPDDPKTVYTAEDIRIQQYGDTAIVAFRLVATTTGTDGMKSVQNLLNSGTFLKRNGKWQVVNWQSTRMARLADEDTRDVKAVLETLHQALTARDVNKIRALTDPDFVWMMHGRRSELTRKQLLAPQSPLKFSRAENSTPTGQTFNLTLQDKISLYGDTAVVHGSDYTMTFVNEAGAWKAVILFTPGLVIEM